MYMRCMCMHVYIQLYKILCMHVYFMYTLWMHACIHVGARACVCMYYACVRARTYMRVFIFASYDLRCVHTYICMHACRPYMHYVGMHE